MTGDFKLFVKKLSECSEFISRDGVILREIIHPDKQHLSVNYSLAHAVVKPGQTSFPHYLKTTELYYIIQGNGIMTIDGESRAVEPGCTVYIPPKSVQSIQNTSDTDLVFLCIVNPPWQQEDEIISDDIKYV